MRLNAILYTMKTTLFNRTRTLSVALLLLCAASCNQGSKFADNTRRKAVDPAFKETVPFKVFTIKAEQNDTITLAEGTKLFIPAGIFVDANGNPVKGNVQLHYRAFYTPGEIISSGISMIYDSANVEHNFSTAGMFEINGTQNGNPIAIAKGKSIDMDFASTRDDAQYSFYEMDTTNAQWNFIRAGKAEPNAMREKLMAEIAKAFSKPVEPRLFDPKKPVINIDVDVKDHPELSGYEGLLWQFAGTGNDPEKNKWIYENNWNSAQLTMQDSATCMYNLSLVGDSKRFSTSVFPTLKGDDFEKAMTQFREKMTDFNAAETVRQEKRKQVVLTTQFQRKTNITRFGICNWDMWMMYGKPEQSLAEFHFEDPDFENSREKVAVYFVAVGGRNLIPYNGAETPNLTFVRDKNTCLIAVLRGTSKTCVLDNSGFLSALKADKTEYAIFKLKPSSHPATTSEDIDDLISKL